MVVLSRAIIDRSLRRPLIAIVAVIGLVAGCISTGEADGPWRGQIIDAVTDRPVSGAIVLMIWWKRFPGMVHEGRELYETKEVVSDAEGRFVVPRVDTRLANPLHRIESPTLRIFKPSYAPEWKFRDQPAPGGDVEARDKWRAGAWRRFEHGGVVIALTPAEGRSERLRAADDLPFGVPPEKAPLFWRASQEELQRLQMERSRQ